MKKIAAFAFALGLAFPALAAKRVTVAQLDQTLDAANATHRPDADLARQLGDLELTERLTDATLNNFAAHLALGPRTALALQLLADQSAFFDPPLSELPATGLPDTATQQRMMDAARGYVVTTWPRLPDFFVTRTTNRFDDGPQVLVAGDWPVRAGLHVVGTASRQVTYREGREVLDTRTQTAAVSPAQQEIGMHSWGEFGPALTVVLTDAAKGQISWSHWEETPAGLAAVFHYSVPRAASHYGVTYCCVTDPKTAPRQAVGYGSRIGGQPAPLVEEDAARHTFTETPGYHGSLSIDPTTGAILRITLEAELKSGDPLLRAATVIEYGPVTVGERRFYFPVRSLAFSMEQSHADGHSGGSGAVEGVEANDAAWGSATSRFDRSPILLLNETSFTRYHRLGTTTRILAAGAVPPTAAPAASKSVTVSQGAPQAETATPNPAESGAAAAPRSIANPATEAATPSADPVPSTPPTPSEPVIPEMSMSEASGLPDQPATANQPQQTGFSLKVTSRLVDLGLVAYDKQGHPVKDLRPQDFEVYDNGRKQEIRFFSQSSGDTANQAANPAENPTPASASATEATPEQSFSNRPSDSSDASAGVIPQAESGATVLLLDESHIAWGDMNNARLQLIQFLGGLAPGERVGLYTINGLGFHVLSEITTGHAALIDLLKKWMPTAQSVSQAQEEETRNRQQFNEVHNVADLNSVNGNHADVPDADQPIDPQLMTMGSNPARASLIILAGVARHLAALSGHKSLVWVSSDNVLADWQDQSVGIDKSLKSIDSYALRAQEAMNEAHAAVYPFDVSQLEAGAIGADVQHRNVELNQASTDIASLPGAAAGGAAMGGRDITPGRVTAAMSQDLHPIQGAIRQVAEATGGRTIRRAGDLAAELTTIVEDGHSTYLIGFHPDLPADGQYHKISVKLTGHRGISLRYRTGYLYAKEPETLKARFQQAVWQPMDVNEIAVSAKVDPMHPGANLQLKIAATDLGLEQRGSSQDSRWMDKLDIFFLERDDAGLHAQVDGQTLGLRLKPVTYQNLLQSGLPFEHFVQLKPGMASLRVVVVDENSGRMGSVTLPAAALGAAQ